MSLSDEEIRSFWGYEYTIDIANSHLEANARIRELEAENEGLRRGQKALYDRLFPEE